MDFWPKIEPTLYPIQGNLTIHITLSCTMIQRWFLERKGFLDTPCKIPTSFGNPSLPYSIYRDLFIGKFFFMLDQSIGMGQRHSQFNWRLFRWIKAIKYFHNNVRFLKSIKTIVSFWYLLMLACTQSFIIRNGPIRKTQVRFEQF